MGDKRVWTACDAEKTDQEAFGVPAKQTVSFVVLLLNSYYSCLLMSFASLSFLIFTLNKVPQDAYVSFLDLFKPG